MPAAIRLDDCLWIRSKNAEIQPVFRPLMRSLAKRGVKVLMLDVSKPEEVTALREHVWKSDQHVIFQGLLPKELNRLQPIFAARRHFSVMPIDWWVSPFWFSEHATFNIFHNYNGLVVRAGKAPFVPGKNPPWFYWPQKYIAYEVISAASRPAVLLGAPLIDLAKAAQRRAAAASATRIVYFPFPIAEEEVPLHNEPPDHDFTSMGATMGTWLMRDPFVPASLNFANLYVDRQRLINLINQFDGRPFKVFDRRHPKHRHTWFSWEDLTKIIRGSRFMLCTGGVHHNSIVKFLEYTCLGVPMIGAALPFEYPLLDDCMIAVDPMRITAEELKPRLTEAVDRHAALRHNCLAVRDQLLRLYHPDALLDMLQEQIDGKPIRPGYLKPGAA